jgi:hypothetical protein
MALPPRPGPGAKPTSRRAGTARAAQGAPGTGRIPPAAPKKNNLPIILGGAGGGLLLLIIIIVAASSGGKKAPPVENYQPVAVKKPEAPKKIVPDVSKLEAEGREKVQAGIDKIRPRLNPAPDAPKERVRTDLEEGLKVLKAGIAAYDKAAQLAGKSYDLTEAKRLQKQAFRLFCDDIEREGQASCDQGLRIIQDCQALMDGKALGDADRDKLRSDLERGKKLLEEGMGLFDRSYQVSEHTFDTNKFGQALKVARSKLLELKK